MRFSAVIAPLTAALAGTTLLVAPAAVAAPTLVDVSRESGVFDRSVHTWSAEAGDVDRDGWDDLLVVNHFEGPAYLYRNQRDGTFSRTEIGEKRDRHNCAFGDANGDGLEDLYCSIGGGKGSRFNPNELWIQAPNGAFEDQAGRYGVTDRRGRGRDVAFLDANRDGLLDLYVANKPGRSDGSQSRNKLFLNVDGQRFRRAPARWRINQEVGGKVVQVVDYDGDRLPDLFVCGDRRTHLYRNVRGHRFRDVSNRARVAEACEGGLMTTIDRDGRPDVAIVTKTRLKVMTQRGDGTFELVYKRRLRGGTEVAAGPVNGDAAPDLYIVQRGEPDSDERDLMLLNRRDGRAFRSIHVPHTPKGKGDYVTSLDYDRNGRADFLVMNGFHKQPGPVRLLATRP